MLIRVLALGLAVTLLCPYAFAGDRDSSAVDEDALKIIEEVDRIMGLDDIRCTQRMTIYRKDGALRSSYLMNVMTSGNEKSFAEITEPPREKGIQMLKLDDVVWVYLPNVRKSIRVSGRSRFMGGNFENNDILRLDLIEDYVPQIVEELPDQYVLDLEGRDLSLTYARIRIWVTKGTLQPVRQEYYSVNGQLIKSAVFSEVKDFGAFRRPAVVEMTSALSPQKKTVLELIDFRKGAKNPSKVFQRSNLGK